MKRIFYITESQLDKLRFSRRMSFVDELADFKVNEITRDLNMCVKYDTSEDFFDAYMGWTIMNLRIEFFENTNSQDWEGVKKFLENYIESKYKKDVIEYFNNICNF